MGAGDTITVNGFTFCADHGQEWCTKCRCDHRTKNNYTIKDSMSSDEFYDMDSRNTIFVYDLGAKKAKEGEAIECTKHGKVDCNVCFNWPVVVKRT